MRPLKHHFQLWRHGSDDVTLCARRSRWIFRGRAGVEGLGRVSGIENPSVIGIYWDKNPRDLFEIRVMN